MYEIDVEALRDCAMDFAASVAEIGWRAGQDTWEAALEAVDDELIPLTGEQLEEMKSWAKESGGWEEEEIEAWSDTETAAIFIQFAAGDVRRYLEDNEREGNVYEHEGRLYTMLCAI